MKDTITTPRPDDPSRIAEMREEIERLTRRLKMAQAVARDLAAWIERSHRPEGATLENDR